MSPTPAGPADRAQLELELRLLPGVVNVGTAADGALTVVALEPGASLAEVATRTTQLHAVEAPVSVVDLSPSARRDNGTGHRGRVALLRAGFDPATGTTEVELAHRQRHGSGLAASGPVVGAVEATLAALRDLGVEVPFYLLGAGPPGSPAVAGPVPVVLVVLRPVGTSATPGERIGVARGASEEEAAARATLAALNRFLSLDGA